ncbi:STAS domain-containing protein [Anaeromyxobacter terrae]|uniref:STAS domain-containing protein n=1 Tax=Anaeromyxobacter terrae TaxID=2925406 RepID=UPI001F561A45|nr:STAS domain-containing protein [Anaeromyxobacter sp. SG22]
MPGSCTFLREVEGGRTVIRLSGVFDRASAAELAERLEVEAGDEVVLDFSLIREFADLGVAALAHELAGGDRRLLLRGLRQHQLRIFRYFGVDVESFQPSPPAPAMH